MLGQTLENSSRQDTYIIKGRRGRLGKLSNLFPSKIKKLKTFCFFNQKKQAKHKCNHVLWLSALQSALRYSALISFSCHLPVCADYKCFSMTFVFVLVIYILYQRSDRMYWGCNSITKLSRYFGIQLFIPLTFSQAE